MWFTIRVVFSLALSFSLTSAVTAQSQSSSSALKSPQPISSSSETAVRGVVAKYFALYAEKDLDALMRMWSSTSPQLEAREVHLRTFCE